MPMLELFKGTTPIFQERITLGHRFQMRGFAKTVEPFEVFLPMTIQGAGHQEAFVLVDRILGQNGDPFFIAADDRVFKDLRLLHDAAFSEICGYVSHREMRLHPAQHFG